MNKKRVAFVTLGCKLNYSETSTIQRDFVENGYLIVPPSEKADVYVINTCSVTEQSDKKSRNIIRRLHRQNEDAIIAVTGCYAQLKPEVVSTIAGVSIILGSEKKGELCREVDRLMNEKVQENIIVEVCGSERIEKIFPAFSAGERTRSFLKVQDGCDYFCTYCTVPLARGKSRNIRVDILVSEAEKIVESGAKEIILTGVNTGDFGKTTGESFLSLLKALNGVEGIERYRISSIEPNLLSEEIIDWIASGTKFLPHFHIPLQSGSDAILAMMKRRYTTTMFREKISMIRAKIDNVFFGIDVIVGFPGETEEHFNETYEFLKEIKPSFIHVFPYSKRPNTPASAYDDQVPDIIKTERVSALEKLSEELYKDFYNLNVGREESVLVENREKDGKLYGYSSNYLKVEIPYDSHKIGEIVKVIIPSKAI